MDAKGDLAAALGSQPVGFQPHVVQHGISVIALHPEESFQEYLRIYFKVPRFTRLTPLAKVFDFIATGVPGPRDMLVVGKIAYEERRREGSGNPMWDLIIVDAAASGQVLGHLTAPRSMLSLVRGGVIRSQVEWIDELVRDRARTTAVLCALPEEMPVVEAIELSDKLRRDAGVAVDACFLNRVVVQTVTPAQRKLVEAMVSAEHCEAVQNRLGGSPEPLVDASTLVTRLHEAGVAQARVLRSRLPIPVVPVPLTPARAGLATTRAVADALAEHAS